MLESINKMGCYKETSASYYIPWIIAFSLFIETLDATILNIAIPQISFAFGASPIVLKIAITVYLLSLSIFIPISGWLADKYGICTIFSIAIFIFIFGSMLCATSENVSTLAIARFIQGAGGAMMMPVGRLILLRLFPKKEFVKVINYVSIPAVAGFALGPVIGGLIVTYMSWRWIFYLNIPIGIIGIFLSQVFIQNIKASCIRKFDGVGFFLFGIGLSTLSISFEIAGDMGKFNDTSIMLTFISVLSFFLYVIYATNIKQPVLNLKILAVRTFRLGLLGNLFSRIGMGGVPYLLPLIFQISLGMTAIKSGILFLPMAAGLLIMKIFGKKIIKKLGFKQVLVGNAILSSTATFLLAFIYRGLPIYCLILILFFYGTCTSLQLTTMNAINYVDISDEHASSATSMAAAIQQAAWGIGVAIAALFLAFFSHYFNLTQEFMIKAFSYTFISLGLICLMAVLIFIRLNSDDGKNVSGYGYQ